MWSDELDVGGLVLGQKEKNSSQPQEGTNSLTTTTTPPPMTNFLGNGKELNEREGRGLGPDLGMGTI